MLKLRNVNSKSISLNTKKVTCLNSLRLSATKPKIDKFLNAAGYELDGNLAKMWVNQKDASTDNNQKPNYSWQSEWNGSLTSPTLTSIDLSALTAKPLGPTTFTSEQIQNFTVTNLSDSHYGVWKDWKPAPTMAPLTTESIRALTTADLAAWKL